MQSMGPATTFFSPKQHAFLDLLPPKVEVFRGCSRPHVRAIAWTTDATVAEGFAKGHRSIRVPEPVVASALIRKEHIFFVMNDRSEKEVVLNPRRLQRLVIKSYPVDASRAA
jgi:hypothetical protein